MDIQNTLSTDPLPRHTQPYLWEDLASLLMRVASRMGYPSPRWILSAETLAHHVRSQNILLLRATQDYHLLKALLSLDEKQLFDLTLHRFAPCFQADSSIGSDQEAGVQHLLLDTGISKSLFHSVKSTKVCPKCLDEDKVYTRLYWHIQPVSICWRHQVFLVDRCPICERPIPLLRPSLTKCPGCQRGDYRQSPVAPLEEDEMLLAGQAIVLRHLGILVEGPAPLQVDLAGCLLATLPGWAFFRLLQAFRSVLVHLFPNDAFLRVPAPIRHLIRHPMYPWNRLTPSEWVVVTTTFWYSFTAWPACFMDLLNALQRVEWKTSPHPGVSRDFGPFYTQWLYKHLKDPVFSFVREAFEEYLHTRYSGAHVNQRLRAFQNKSPDQFSEHLYLNQVQACKALGVRRSTLDYLIERGLLKAVKRPYGKAVVKSLYLIEKPSLEKLLRTWENVIPLETLATGILGIGCRAVQAMEAARMLRPIQGNQGRSERFCLYDGSQVQRFISALRKRARRGSSSLPGAVPLARVHFFLGAGVTFVQSLVLVFQGKLCPIELERELPWLQRLVIPSEELSRLRHVYQEYRQQERHLLTMSEAAVYIGVSEHTLYRWVEWGFLRRERESIGWGQPWALFRRGVLEDFKQTYLLVEEAARLLQTSLGVVRRLIRIGTLHPLVGKGQRASWRYLLRRAEIVQFHQQKILSLAEAAAILNINTHVLIQLVHQGQVSALPEPGIRLSQLQFSRAEIERYYHQETKQEGDNNEREWLTTVEAARMLGLHVGTMGAWARNGRVSASKQLRNGCMVYLFRRSAIEPLREVYRDLPQSHRERGRPRLVTSAEAAQLLGCAETAIVDLVQQGRLKAEPFNEGSDAKNGLFRRDEVERTLGWLHAQEGLLSPQEAARRIGESWDRFYRCWVKTGHLQAVEGLAPGSGQWFRQTDVEQIAAQKADSMSVQEVAQLLGISRSTVVQWIKRGELQAIAGPDVDGFGNYLISKCAMEQKSNLPLPSSLKGVAARTRSKAVKDALTTAL